MCSMLNSPSSPTTNSPTTTSGAHQLPPHPFPVFNVTAPSDCDSTEDNNSDVNEADQDAIIDTPTDPTNDRSAYSCSTHFSL